MIDRTTKNDDVCSMIEAAFKPETSIIRDEMPLMYLLVSVMMNFVILELKGYEIYKCENFQNAKDRKQYQSSCRKPSGKNKTQ